MKRIPGALTNTALSTILVLTLMPEAAFAEAMSQNEAMPSPTGRATNESVPSEGTAPQADAVNSQATSESLPSAATLQAPEFAQADTEFLPAEDESSLSGEASALGATPGYDLSAVRSAETTGAYAWSQDASRFAAESQNSSDDLVWDGDWAYRVITENNETCAFVEGYKGEETDVVIPETVGGYPVRVLSLSTVSVSEGNNAKQVTRFSIPACVTRISSYCFASCGSLQEVVIPEDSRLTNIGDYAFANSGITHFAMPASLRTIYQSAFIGCPNLETVTFNENLEPLYYHVNILSGSNRYQYDEPINPFAGCPNLQFVIPATSQNFILVDGVLFSRDKETLYCYPLNKEGDSYDVPVGVKAIAADAFGTVQSLTSVTLPEGLEGIYECAFKSTCMSEMVIPDSVTVIGGHVLAWNTALESLTLGSGLTELGNYAGWNGCYQCTNLKNVVLGPNVQMIGNAWFAYTALESIYLPPSVTQLNFGAFAECENLQTVTGGAGLVSIYTRAFDNDTKLASFPFGDKLRLISATAFRGTQVTEGQYPGYLVKESSGDYVAYDGYAAFAGLQDYAGAYEVLNLVNQERAKEGLSALTMDTELMNAAMLRAAELCVLMEHNRPVGGNCFTVSAKAVGENIAGGQSSPADVMTSWMNSAPHKANILGSQYNSLGVGCFKQGSVYRWVQLFGASEGDNPQMPANRDVISQVPLKDPSAGGFEVEMELTGVPSQVRAGDTATLSARTTNSGFLKSTLDPSCLEWTSSNPAVVTVDAAGNMTAVHEGTATVTAVIAGTSFAASANLSIEAAKETDLGKAQIVGLPTSVVYNTQPHTPSFQVVLNDETLPETAYTVSYGSNTNVGNATVTITGTGEYTGTQTTTFPIVKASIEGPEFVVTAIPKQKWTGSALTPEPTITFNGMRLVKNRDYTITYSNNVNAGTGYALVVGEGNFNGTRSISFQIEKASQSSNTSQTTPSTQKPSSGTSSNTTAQKPASGSSTNNTTAQKTGWQRSGSKWWYKTGANTWATGWKKIDKKWYLFDKSGWMLTGWQNVSGKWYWFDSNGVMATGWKKLGGRWYYLDPSSGAMRNGWSKVGAKWYYHDNTGAMQTGWRKVGGVWYWFDSSGAMATGWQKIGGTWYRFNNAGAMQTGWQKIGAKWYYLAQSGAMAANRWIGDYWLTSSGAMATKQWVDSERYYVGSDGRYVPANKMITREHRGYATITWPALYQEAAKEGFVGDLLTGAHQIVVLSHYAMFPVPNTSQHCFGSGIVEASYPKGKSVKKNSVEGREMGESLWNLAHNKKPEFYKVYSKADLRKMTRLMSLGKVSYEQLYACPSAAKAGDLMEAATKNIVVTINYDF